MFSVKHIRISGEEHLITADALQYFPSRKARGCEQSASGQPSDAKPEPRVEAYGEYGTQNIYHGTVFAMNEAGATVSRWDLGASPIPLGRNVDGVNCTREAA